MPGQNVVPDPDREGQPPEPEETGGLPDQIHAQPAELVPADRISAGGGLRDSTLGDIVSSLVFRNPQLRSVLNIVFRQADRRQDRVQARIEELEKELRDEQVAHARTDERLRGGQMQTGAQVMLQILGGGALSFGLSNLQGERFYLGVLVGAVGVVMIAVGCWPIITLRWRRRG